MGIIGSIRGKLGKNNGCIRGKLGKNKDKWG